MLSASRGYFDTLSLLLNSGIDIDALDSRNLSALFFASQNGHLDAVKLLFQRNASLTSGESPLFPAVSNNHFHIARLLISHGADLNAFNPSVDSSKVLRLINAAANLNNAAIIKML